MASRVDWPMTPADPLAARLAEIEARRRAEVWARQMRLTAAETDSLLILVADVMAQARQEERERMEGLQAALDGTHFHHKAFEPLCRHCQEAEAALRRDAGGEGARG